MINTHETRDYDQRYSHDTNNEGKHYDYFLGIWVHEWEIEEGFNIDTSTIRRF
jgi:hypothetical protein